MQQVVGTLCVHLALLLKSNRNGNLMQFGKPELDPAFGERGGKLLAATGYYLAIGVSCKQHLFECPECCMLGHTDCSLTYWPLISQSPWQCISQEKNPTLNLTPYTLLLSQPQAVQRVIYINHVLTHCRLLKRKFRVILELLYLNKSTEIGCLSIALVSLPRSSLQCEELFQIR